MVEFLLLKGADINAVDDVGETALYKACYKGYLEIVDFLIGKGANLNILDDSDFTPLDTAKWKEHDEIAQLLSSAGAIETPNSDSSNSSDS